MEIFELISIPFEEASELLVDYKMSASDIYELDEEISEIFEEITDDELALFKPKNIKNCLIKYKVFSVL
ncbi:hypothetical protein PL321_13205 [Caloramator sp. mosi_1]|uniref:hypothetical protein n=1 Tax=Caloramator sp. mosi_1 TaxID=3023090 RepID=UPI00235FA086|nr:hypothetical protein [Caloramator sp. mosi_1]WDC83601.1 hypothetical protein PL321_13205 [Caloramator sp. mosi_1]